MRRAGRGTAGAPGSGAGSEFRPAGYPRAGPAGGLCLGSCWQLQGPLRLPSTPLHLQPPGPPHTSVSPASPALPCSPCLALSPHTHPPAPPHTHTAAWAPARRLTWCTREGRATTSPSCAPSCSEGAPAALKHSQPRTGAPPVPPLHRQHTTAPRLYLFTCHLPHTSPAWAAQRDEARIWRRRPCTIRHGGGAAAPLPRTPSRQRGAAPAAVAPPAQRPPGPAAAPPPIFTDRLSTDPPTTTRQDTHAFVSFRSVSALSATTSSAPAPQLLAHTCPHPSRPPY